MAEKGADGECCQGWRFRWPAYQKSWTAEYPETPEYRGRCWRRSHHASGSGTRGDIEEIRELRYKGILKALGPSWIEEDHSKCRPSVVFNLGRSG